MDDADLRLDGNAAAGLLAELFTFDVTTAQAVCCCCGAHGPIGNLVAYGLAMGAILRCPGCDSPLIRVSKTENGYWLDLRGTRVIHVERSA